MRNLLILLVSIILLASCRTGPPNYPYADEPDPSKSEFVIGVSDQLRIRVWKNQELNTEIQVRPDGTITMPLIGDVKAAGLTPTQLRDEIGRKLQAFIREDGATVTVAVAEVNSYRVTVSGNVMQPGVYGSRRFITVSEAIALAGGPNRFGDASDMVLIREDAQGQVRRIPIDYDQIVEGNFLEQNLVLLAGDQLFVP